MVPQIAGIFDVIIVLPPAEKVLSLEIERNIGVISETECDAMIHIGDAHIALVSDCHIRKKTVDFPDHFLVCHCDIRPLAPFIIEHVALQGIIAVFHVRLQSGIPGIIVEIQNGILRNRVVRDLRHSIFFLRRSILCYLIFLFYLVFRRSLFIVFAAAGGKHTYKDCPCDQKPYSSFSI